MGKNKITPVKLCGPMHTGKSLSQLIEFSDGKKYVVKFKNNPRGTRKLVNEYIVAKLAEQLSLPVVPFRLVNISERFIKKNELDRFGFAAGTQFASRYLRKSRTQKTLTPTKVQNTPSLPGIVVFDQWVSNVDRSRSNILFKKLPTGQVKVYMIDHEKCFPGWGSWNVSRLKTKSLELQKKSVHRWCARFISGKIQFLPYIERIMDLPEEKLVRIMNSIPRDWDVKDCEKMALVRHLMQAKWEIPKLVDKFADKVLVPVHKKSHHKKSSRT